jgi:hypothetical protein
VPDIKKISKQLGLPSAGKWSGHNFSWSVRGGHAGGNVVDKVRKAAEAAGWKKGSHHSGGNADGSVVGSGNEMVSPEGHKLSVWSSYGATKDSNSFGINLTLNPHAESKQYNLDSTRRLLEATWK